MKSTSCTVKKKALTHKNNGHSCKILFKRSTLIKSSKLLVIYVWKCVGEHELCGCRIWVFDRILSEDSGLQGYNAVFLGGCVHFQVIFMDFLTLEDERTMFLKTHPTSQCHLKTDKSTSCLFMQKFLIWSFGMWPSEVLPSLLYIIWLTAQTPIGEVKEHVGMVEKACLKLSLLNFGLRCCTILLSFPIK